MFWERIPTGTNTISVDVPAGNHKITVIKESEINPKESDYCDLTTLTFGGKIEAAPENTDILIEYVGDSYTCGHGTIAEYQAGVVWSVYDHSFVHAYPWYTSQILDADYSIAAKGGIGLFKGVSAQEGTTHTATIADIYDYTSGYRKSEGLYGFERHPDIIIIEIGANDSISTTDANKTIEAWKSHLEDLTDQIRAKNPDAAIVYWNHRAIKFRAMMQIVEERKETDPNLYAFSFSHQGNGAAAVKNQYVGHPSAEDSESLAKALSAFLVEKGLVPQEKSEPDYNNLIYYAAENGDDTNDGKSIGAAKKNGESNEQVIAAAAPAKFKYIGFLRKIQKIATMITKGAPWSTFNIWHQRTVTTAIKTFSRAFFFPSSLKFPHRNNINMQSKIPKTGLRLPKSRNFALNAILYGISLNTASVRTLWK